MPLFNSQPLIKTKDSFQRPKDTQERVEEVMGRPDSEVLSFPDLCPRILIEITVWMGLKVDGDLVL